VSNNGYTYINIPLCFVVSLFRRRFISGELINLNLYLRTNWSHFKDMTTLNVKLTSMVSHESAFKAFRVINLLLPWVIVSCCSLLLVIVIVQSKLLWSRTSYQWPWEFWPLSSLFFFVFKFVIMPLSLDSGPHTCYDLYFVINGQSRNDTMKHWYFCSDNHLWERHKLIVMFVLFVSF